MEFSINIARSKCQKVKVKPVFPRNESSCMSLFGIVLHAVHVMFTCYTSEPVQTGSNRFKLVQTGKNPEKKCTVSSNGRLYKPTATAIAITTVLRSLQSTSRCRDGSKVCKYILYIIFVCSKVIHRNNNRSPIFAHLFRRITSNDEIHMFKMQKSFCKKLPFTSPYKNGV